MADIWDNTKKNKRNDLTVKTQDLTLKLGLNPIQYFAFPGTEKLTYGKAS